MTLANTIRRIDSIDGVRAFSILLVIVAHLFGTQDTFIQYNLKSYVGDLGSLGVRIFFVISGFLITTLLINELNLTGKISLKNFYLRRSLRIFPAFYVFLLAMLLLTYFNFIEIEPYLFTRAATYTINYLPVEDRAWYLGHLWSLAVEEQFYLLWPIVFLIAGKKRAIPIVIAVICLLPLVRYFSWLYLPNTRPLIKWTFHTVCDSISSGCLLALVRSRLHGINLYSRWLSSRLPLMLPFFLFAVNLYLVGRPRFNYLIAYSALNIAIVLFLDYVITRPPKFLYTILNHKIIVELGLLSYSLYLWQQFFLTSEPTLVIQKFPLNIMLIPVFAYFSYYFIEKRFLNLKDKFK